MSDGPAGDMMRKRRKRKGDITDYSLWSLPKSMMSPFPVPFSGLLHNYSAWRNSVSGVKTVRNVILGVLLAIAILVGLWACVFVFVGLPAVAWHKQSLTAGSMVDVCHELCNYREKYGR